MRAAAWVLTIGMAQAALAAPLPDPTRPADYSPYVPVEIPAEVIDWRVTGITISSTARSAILNGQVVVPGQIMGPATVVEIRPRAVVLDYDGQEIVVELVRSVVKRPASTPQGKDDGG